jgi:isopenicillin-N N-acyltransferase-like protein
MLRFTGSPAERGYQHGVALRPQIERRWRATVDLHGANASGRDLEELAEPWRQAIVDSAPAAADELAGVARGSQQPLHRIVLLNAFEAFGPDDQVHLGGCTCVGLDTSRGPVVGQNWDANPSLAGSADIHHHVDPAGLDVAVLASPGGLGWIGMNEVGLALLNSDLLTTGHAVGVPSQVVRRLVLAQPDSAGALAVLAATPPVGGRAYLLADASSHLAVVEMAPGVGLRDTSGFGPVHTNHGLDAEVAARESPSLIEEIYPSTHRRFDRAHTLLGSIEASVAGVRSALADHHGHPFSICRHETPCEPTITAASVVLDCATRTIHYALGNPCTRPWAAISLQPHRPRPEVAPTQW